MQRTKRAFALVVALGLLAGALMFDSGTAPAVHAGGPTPTPTITNGNGGGDWPGG